MDVNFNQTVSIDDNTEYMRFSPTWHFLCIWKLFKNRICCIFNEKAAVLRVSSWQKVVVVVDSSDFDSSAEFVNLL